MGGVAIKNRDFFDNSISESIKEDFEINQRLTKAIEPSLEQQEKIQKIIDSSNLTSFNTKIIDSVPNVIENINKSIYQSNEINNMINQVNFRFAESFSGVFKEINKNISISFNSAVARIIKNEMSILSENINNMIGIWLKSLDLSPFANIFNAWYDFDINIDLKKLDDIYLKAMFAAKWFPYAGSNTDISLMSEIINIIDTSRESKNREKRIDKAVFTCYNKKEIQNIKRQWRCKGLPEYMIRILIQSVQAYNRREYALTVSALATLWEGIICEKVNDEEYRVSKKTRENLKNLITENKYEEIFSSFCDEFIFYDCYGKGDVKPDVPGRHGIAHCWYNKYPSRKAALNAILFTDFLLQLEPLDISEKLEEEDDK